MKQKRLKKSYKTVTIMFIYANHTRFSLFNMISINELYVIYRFMHSSFQGTYSLIRYFKQIFSFLKYLPRPEIYESLFKICKTLFSMYKFSSFTTGASINLYLVSSLIFPLSIVILHLASIYVNSNGKCGKLSGLLT